MVKGWCQFGSGFLYSCPAVGVLTNRQADGAPKESNRGTITTTTTTTMSEEGRPEGSEPITIRVRDQVSTYKHTYTRIHYKQEEEEEEKGAGCVRSIVFILACHLFSLCLFCHLVVVLLRYTRRTHALFVVATVVVEKKRREKKPFSKSKRRRKCPKSLKPTHKGKGFNRRRCVSCWMVNASMAIIHPKCWNWTIKTRLIACWNKPEEETVLEMW